MSEIVWIERTAQERLAHKQPHVGGNVIEGYRYSNGSEHMGKHDVRLFYWGGPAVEITHVAVRQS